MNFKEKKFIQTNSPVQQETSIEKKFILYTLVITLGLSIILFLIHYYGPPQFNPLNNFAIFYYFIIKYDTPVSILFIGIILAVLMLKINNSSYKLLSLCEKLPRSFIVVILLILCLLSITFYRGRPLCMDEFSPWFQAKTFAAGSLNGKVPPKIMPLAFPFPINGFIPGNPETGKMLSKYWPGFALLLTPFMALGIPWLLNPLLSIGIILLLRRLSKQLFPNHKEMSGWVILLTLTSPQFLITGISFYTMQAHLFFNLAFLTLFLENKNRALFIAGLCGSLAMLQHKLAPHLLFAFPWFILLFTQKKGIRRGLVLVSGYIPLLTLLGGGYYLLRSSVLGNFGDKQQENSVIQFISHIIPISLPTYEIIWIRLLCFVKTWLWAVPGLITLTALGIYFKRKEKYFIALAASLILTFVATFFFGGSQGHGWGFRYFHSVWAVMPLLAIPTLLAAKNSGLTQIKANTLVPPLKEMVLALCILSLFVVTSLQLFFIHDHMSNHYRNLPPFDPDVNSIVFIRSQSFYTVDMIQNDPFLRNSYLLLASPGSLQKEKNIIQNYFPKAELSKQDRLKRVWLLPKHPKKYLENNNDS